MGAVSADQNNRMRRKAEPRRVRGEFQIGTVGVYPPCFFEECASALECADCKSSIFGSAQVRENARDAETRKVRTNVILRLEKELHGSY